MSALIVESLSKSFYLYKKPHQRLLASLFPALNKNVQKFQAINDVSLTLNKGETLGIVGRNGAGKSTLLQLICGTLTPTVGEIRIAGRIAALLELGAGFNNDFTGRENIYLNAAIYGLSKVQVDHKLEGIIAFADIGDFIDRPVKVYSSGMFVRLAFAIIAHVDADILVIDEALAVGDALFAQKCMRFLQAFKKQGAIIFVSHDSGAVSQLCDKAIWLNAGKVALAGDAKAVTEAYLEFLYSETQPEQFEIKGDTELTKALRPKIMGSWHDPRQEFLRNSNVRNDIKLFEFDPLTPSFGSGSVELLDVYFQDEHARRLQWVIGGSIVHLCVGLASSIDIEHLIVGFLVKNKLGQVLFGENNLVFEREVFLKCGEPHTAIYKLQMPYLAIGEYVLTIGIASGTQENHVQHCWAHDALVFSCDSTHVIHGLFGTAVMDFSLSSSK